MSRQSPTRPVPTPERQAEVRPPTHAPEGLVQALADLLLQAHGAARLPAANPKEAGDEREDHA